MQGGVPVAAAEQQEETFLEKKILQLHMDPNSNAHGVNHCNLHQVSNAIRLLSIYLSIYLFVSLSIRTHMTRGIFPPAYHCAWDDKPGWYALVGSAGGAQEAFQGAARTVRLPRHQAAL